MHTTHHIQHTDITDLQQILDFFEASVQYQEANGYPVWKNYDKGVLLKDIESKNHYKLMHDATIAMVFSVRYDDKIIWRHRDTSDAIYLHRIVVNPACKGQKLFASVLDWAVQHAHQRNLKSVRMDTWANNPPLIQYYQRFGFTVVEDYTTPDSMDLPVHNRNLAVTLLEYRL